MRAVISSVGHLGRLRCRCMSVRAGPWECAIVRLASAADTVAWRPAVSSVVLSHDWFRTRGGVGTQRKVAVWDARDTTLNVVWTLLSQQESREVRLARMETGPY